LRQSILKSAFEGKLVSQDPNDEPANILLQRIESNRINKTKDTEKVKYKQSKLFNNLKK
jgi:type I restriction enzyme S subunit